jgi:hypothetical protein
MVLMARDRVVDSLEPHFGPGAAIPKLPAGMCDERYDVIRDPTSAPRRIPGCQCGHAPIAVAVLPSPNGPSTKTDAIGRGFLAILLGQPEHRQTLPDAPAKLRPNLQLPKLVFHGVPSPGQASTHPRWSGESYVDTSPPPARRPATASIRSPITSERAGRGARGTRPTGGAAGHQGGGPLEQLQWTAWL